MRIRTAICLLASIAVPSGTHAQGESASPAIVDTIDVVALRPFPEEQIHNLRGFVQVLPVDPSARASADLADLLGGAVGLQIRRYGGIGSYALVSVRGSSPSHILVTIDDTPISSGPDGMTNLALLPAKLFDRIEVDRGPMASMSGGTSAGVVRLVSPSEPDGRPRLQVGVGSFGSRNVGASLGRSLNDFSVLLAGGWTESKGDYPYQDRKGTPWESIDDATVRRQNNAFHQEDLLLQLRWKIQTNFRIETIGHGVWKDAGIPGTENLQTERVHDRFRRWFQTVSASGERAAPTEWKVVGHLQEDVDRYSNPGGEIGLGRAEFRSRLRTEGLTFRLKQSIPRLHLAVGVSGGTSSESWTPTDLLGEETEPTRGRTAREGTVDIAGRALSDRIDILLQQHWVVSEEAAQDRGNGLARSIQAPRFGLSARAGRGTRLKAGWRSITRIPSFVELFGRGGISEGNPNLVCENGSSWDVGGEAIWQAGSGRLHLRVEAAYFRMRVANAIVWLQNSQRTTRPWNLEQTSAEGVEVTVQTKHHPQSRKPHIRDPFLSTAINYTLQDAHDRGPTERYNGKLLPYQPVHHLYVETMADAGRIMVTHRLEHESESYRDRYNSSSSRRPASTKHELEVLYRLLSGRLDAILAIQNLSDNHVQDVEGFPLPGRSYTFHLTYSI